MKRLHLHVAVEDPAPDAEPAQAETSSCCGAPAKAALPLAADPRVTR
ncbi:MAG: hypothetical protein Q8M88_01710 [Phenylobacterium sp.]|nr:hypothetical protein [Phenylobacterium sp.]MDP3173133.1 hypothetical protein [Phenylobacterium sp.]